MKHVQEKEIGKAYTCIKNGGLAIIPSRVGYTLLGNSESSIKKMFELKGRPLTKPCVVLTRHDFLEDIAYIPERHFPFIDAIEEQKLLCGFILKRKEHEVFNSLTQYVSQYSKREDDTSCFVINAGEYIQSLVDYALQDGTLVVGSSANQSGTGNEGVFENIPEKIRGGVDYALKDDVFVGREYNYETREQGVMVDLFDENPKIIRKGIMYSHIKKLMEEKITK